MGIFSKIFSKNEKKPQNSTVSNEGAELLRLKSFMDILTKCNHYIAKSEFKDKIAEYQKTVEFFSVLKNSGMLENYCSSNGLDSTETEQTLSRYNSINSLIDSFNEQYINKELILQKEYLDNILKDYDPNILLDDDQRRVVLTDEDYCLVVAGAGAGKTTTVAAKVKYLVERQNVDPKKILVISFTNKAVNELKERIIGDLHINCPIATFHSTGNAILHKQSADKLNIVDPTKLYYVVRDYLRESILKNESAVNNLILFFASYFDAPPECTDLNMFFNKMAKLNLATMRSELDEFRRDIIDTRTKKSVTIQSEVMRSQQEVEIANFLYLNNIDYEYEPLYRYDILLAHKPYTPDFIIRQGDNEAYIEHFGITENGENNRYSQDELNTYKKAINDKILLHRKHGTKLIYTFSSFNDGRTISEHLSESLQNNGFILSPRSPKDVLEKLITSEENHYIRKLVALICRFITNFKTNGYSDDEFSRMYHSTQNVRTRLFLNICNDCYMEYQRYLRQNGAVDFQDMINESARILGEVKEMKQKLDFQYIIVDEYQDISRQRFDLVTALREVTTAKIIAVGDDWQSIYAFSGSDISLFTKFVEKMGYAKMLKIVRTYRNSQEVIDIAGNFIQKNPEQIQKALVSPKSIENPVIIYTYNTTRKNKNADKHTGANYALAHAVETAIEQIIEYNKIEKKPYDSSILLLGRFGFDGDMLEKSGLFEYINRGGRIKSVKYPKLNITFMTAHSSKGLGYDNVIIINGRNEIYGFPSKIENDPVLEFVIKNDTSIDYAEERRLFYVAMTRTKNRVYFVAPEQNPSEFLLELKHDFKNVILKGEWNDDPEMLQRYRKACPICGYPLQLRYKPSYGLRMYICTNEPEICSFITNEPKAGKLSIIKCDQCRDGYLVIKPGKESGYCLGCTNYSKNGTGCNRFMSKKYFYDFMGIKNDIPAERVEPIKPLKLSTESFHSSNANNESKPKVIPDAINENPVIVKAENKNIKYCGMDTNEIIYTILNCLSHISAHRYYGITVLTDTLRGSKSEKILKSQLNLVPEYGALKTIDRDSITFIIKWMIKNKFILQTKELYPVLHPTYEGEHYSETITKPLLKKLVTSLEDQQSEV